MLPIRMTVVCVALTGLASLSVGYRQALSQDPPASGTPEATAPAPEVSAAITVLKSAATREEKVNACRRLGAVGGREAIVPLSELLGDAELAHAARMALEAIPDPAASEALRAALPRLTGLPLVGVIHSLAARRAVEAVADLGPYLTHSDPQVAAAACTALGTIASPDAIALLENGWPTIATEVRTEWGLAVLRAVSSLRAQQMDEQAMRLCRLLRESEVSAQVRQAATRHAILIRPADAGPLLRELLSAADRGSFAMGLTVSRELTDPSVTQSLLECLGTLAAERRVQVMGVLGDRGDVAARDALMEYAQTGDAATRAAALQALGQAGDALAVPLLLAAASESSAGIVSAARQALITLEGTEVDAALQQALTNTTGSLRPVLIDVVGQRRIESATDALVALVDDADAATRLAALRALGQVVDASRLSVLVSRLAVTQNSDELATLQQALRAACGRTVQPEAVTQLLCNQAGKLDKDQQKFVLELLATVGGPAALKAIADMGRAGDASTQDAVSKALGRWRTPDVAPALLELAHGAKQEKIRIRALRGYLRVIRQMDMSNADKLTMYRQACDAAMRDEERLLAVKTLGRIPTAEALAEAVKQLEVESLRAAACEAAVSIAEPLAASQPAAVADAMQRVLANTHDPELTRRAQAVLDAGKQ